MPVFRPDARPLYIGRVVGEKLTKENTRVAVVNTPPDVFKEIAVRDNDEVVICVDVKVRMNYLRTLAALANSFSRTTPQPAAAPAGPPLTRGRYARRRGRGAYSSPSVVPTAAPLTPEDQAWRDACNPVKGEACFFTRDHTFKKLSLTVPSGTEAVVKWAGPNRYVPNGLCFLVQGSVGATPFEGFVNEGIVRTLDPLDNYAVGLIEADQQKETDSVGATA